MSALGPGCVKTKSWARKRNIDSQITPSRQHKFAYDAELFQLLRGAPLQLRFYTAWVMCGRLRFRGHGGQHQTDPHPDMTDSHGFNLVYRPPRGVAGIMAASIEEGVRRQEGQAAGPQPVHRLRHRGIDRAPPERARDRGRIDPGRPPAAPDGGRETQAGAGLSFLFALGVPWGVDDFQDVMVALGRGIAEFFLQPETGGPGDALRRRFRHQRLDAQ